MKSEVKGRKGGFFRSNLTSILVHLIKAWESREIETERKRINECLFFLQLKLFHGKCWSYLSLTYSWIPSVTNEHFFLSHKEFKKCASLRRSKAKAWRCLMCIFALSVIACWHVSFVNFLASDRNSWSEWGEEQRELGFQDVRLCLISVIY